jgi:excinuclease ABC subunit B
LIRPTGLLDPEVVVRPIRGQIDNLLGEIRRRTERGERVLVTTLTKRMAEDLSEFLAMRGVRVRYLHSDIAVIDRVKILRDLRLGAFDVLVGINLLREGLDLPEVSLVAILDADKEGFLRSDRSLIQTIGRAARNANGTAILYADRITDSMRRAIDETERRRVTQAGYNQEHGVTPRSIIKSVDEIRFSTAVADARERQPSVRERIASYENLKPDELVEVLEREMREAAEALDFERAARLRDDLFEVKAKLESRPTDRGAARSRLSALRSVEPGHG